ncbi:glycoside hydrolase family 31 protein [Bacillus sp. B-jedd]|uniref:glycoside hydrolase family 31 protein n=1 Tax=Bacillus sp. B-jedd TaxID=1476857 RepID=UPI000515705E|nr:glycoside hydrolase family 31 protein [Bacillus sp. B-jedd]CEG26301.1 glycoside hydrolase family protein [Bacillus sp. B-jedd]
MRMKMLEREYWYGGFVHEGVSEPIGEESYRQYDLRLNRTPNQAMPLFLSSRGRYLWGDKGFVITFDRGTIEVEGDIELGEGYGDLKGAYLQAMTTFFPFQKKGPSIELFRSPIYNSWIELTFYQNEQDILKYAEDILANGLPAGVMMIDDGWSDYYGKWKFNKEKFPNPEKMIQTLHDKGFHVMLWVSPYITPDTVEYRETRDKQFLVKNADGKPFITEWWNGHSAVLDFSNPDTIVWMDEQLSRLCEMGVDGFKFDGGDSTHYRDDNVTFGNVTPDEQSLAWAKYGEKYPFNEYRVTSKAGGMSLLQRLCDKEHSWGNTGIGALIPNSLLQGITGHPFSCPDMIGGGEYLNFLHLDKGSLDPELFVRHSEIACLMPAMQFSAAPYRVLEQAYFDQILQSVQTRKNYQDRIEQLVMHAKETGEPIIRYMSYEFPDEAVEKIIDQFMLGSDILVAPVSEKGAEGKKVYIPKGQWKYGEDVLSSEGEYHNFTSTPGIPVILERV